MSRICGADISRLHTQSRGDSEDERGTGEGRRTQAVERRYECWRGVLDDWKSEDMADFSHLVQG